MARARTSRHLRASRSLVLRSRLDERHRCARSPSRVLDEGLVVLADRQTAGRGRLGRSWASPPGAGIYVSVVLRPSAAAARLVTIAAGVAVDRWHRVGDGSLHARKMAERRARQRPQARRHSGRGRGQSRCRSASASTCSRPRILRMSRSARRRSRPSSVALSIAVSSSPSASPRWPRVIVNCSENRGAGHRRGVANAGGSDARSSRRMGIGWRASHRHGGEHRR